VRKRQHQYLEFGHTQGEIQKNPAKKYISIQLGVKLFPQFHPVFLFSRAPPLLAATWIFTAPTCTATIIPLEPSTLNAQIQHFVLSFSISY
jgi:hypothetical protein